MNDDDDEETFTWLLETDGALTGQECKNQCDSLQ